MKLIVGLGNPGARYAGNRHNIGFMALDRIAADHGFGPWKGKHQGSLTEARFGSDRAVLLKPETFMNNSGQSVQAAMRFYKLTPGDVVVLHDEIDLAPGKVKHKVGGGHAGHNGLRSVHAHIGPDYARVRLGVGHPGHKDRVPSYVLSDFAKADQDWLDDVLRGISDGAAWLAAGAPDKFLNAVALRTAPPRSGTGNQKPAAAKAAKPAKPAAIDKPAQPRAAAPDTPAPDDRTAMQKLLDRFR
ncbi:aminoacyl-tRNA hydrolase [uncultured Roseobacter sp.]|uniref:aminoacyl-tRNA hydrolase n=1 Tax=uncultured Roseobacter sp. TaxID=114847 RepID=UPI002608C218|nr:aminoacyl-tRNA hydrolase [uncultured Roseobacter sp.]